MTVLSASDLRKIYEIGKQNVHALDGVSLQVEEGEFVAVMGPSGSGKSTLLHLLGGLDQPSGGDITLAGIKVSLLSDQEATLLRRRNIGFVFQFYNLLPTLSAKENILLPLIIDGKKPRDHEKRLQELLLRVGLSDRADHRPSELSGGEQQRVSLARALITQPKVLLADEPTGNLDSRTGNQVMELLGELSRDLNQTIIMVTHDPKAAAHADRVVFLQDGRIREEISLTGIRSMQKKVKSVLSRIESWE
ncbi:ABC transporter ATP-binding protein [Proteiniclasticum sp. SCR006]|uniref:ABC transporter ATP-binding protein n=1 Tax=Proteiniclasticum aestuarii TaxID=2817862 RepID=A0A939KJ35_9CLOT|nr:ABC transporter ATP-binding protein [Proteiniclasticum aestuarii]MBO1264631.1 ABC transporter ATP-binding protein [Proteiniclasticum aestuarii]